MTADEEKYIGLFINKAVTDAVTPLTRSIQSLHQTVHGENGLDGDGSLVGDLITMKKRHNNLVTLGGIAQGVGAGIAFWLGQLFGHK